jgi:hypothetical protein
LRVPAAQQGMFTWWEKVTVQYRLCSRFENVADRYFYNDERHLQWWTNYNS